MQKLPLLVTCVALLAGYMPYQMSFAFANPMLVLVYAFLAWPAAVMTGRVGLSVGICAGILGLGFVTMNVSSGAPEFVLPSRGVLIAAGCVMLSGALAAVSLRHWLEQRGWSAERAQAWLRGGFLVVGALVYFNSYLPYEWKMWIAERTTNEDLIRFALAVSAGFLAVFLVSGRKYGNMANDK